MHAIKNILVTTDFSDYSAAALDYGISLASVYGADLHLLHVVEDRLRASAAQEELARKKLQKFVFENVEELTWLTQVIRTGQPHEEIVRYVREQHIDLIVIATHGRTGIAHVLMGSMAEKVIRHSPVPVLAVKPNAILEQLITRQDVEADLHILNRS
jgi:nucleotide-binding universal stress UspA family protein